MLPVNEIEPAVKETFAGVEAMANEIHKEHLKSSTGPKVTWG